MIWFWEWNTSEKNPLGNSSVDGGNIFWNHETTTNILYALTVIFFIWPFFRYVYINIEVIWGILVYFYKFGVFWYIVINRNRKWVIGEWVAELKMNVPCCFVCFSKNKNTTKLCLFCWSWHFVFLYFVFSILIFILFNNVDQFNLFTGTSNSNDIQQSQQTTKIKA